MVLISVVIPIYNAQRYIRQCLDSILNQTFETTEYEIICVDDGSIDDTNKILMEYVSKHSNVVLIKQNHQGQGPSRNAGVKVARGKYIKFVDADDFLHPNALRSLYDIASIHHTDIVVCRAFCIDDKGEQLSLLSMWNHLTGHYTIDEIKEVDFFNNACSPVLWDKLISADIAKEYLSPALRRGQDFVTLLSYLSVCRSIYFTEERLYYYRHHQHSVMAEPESRHTIMTDLLTEKTALVILKENFANTMAYTYYGNRIKREWDERILKNKNLLSDEDIIAIKEVISH